MLVKKLDESLLSGVPAFGLLARAQIREILDQATSRLYPEGTIVFSAGEVAERFYLLLDGTIRVLRHTPEGEQIVLMHIAAGQLFGIAPALGSKVYPGTAQAASDVIALSWPVRLWHAFVARYEGFASETYRVVGARFEELHARIAELATRQVESRVAAALLRMAEASGRKTEEGIEIGFPVTRQNIAEMTGTTLHTVSRLLSGWEREGIVCSARRKVIVVAPHRLVQIATAPHA